MMKEHEEYKLLCGLAAAGEILPDDLQDLKQHLDECEECRLLFSDFVQVSAQAFPLLSDHNYRAVPSGMKTKFVERARTEGIPLRSSTRSVVTGASSSYGLMLPRLAWAGLVVLGVAIGLAVWHVGNARLPTSVQGRNETFSSPVVTGPPPIGDERQTRLRSESALVLRLKTELAKEQNKGRALEAGTVASEHDRDAARQESAALLARLTKLQTEVSTLRDANKKQEDLQSAEADHIAALAERQDLIDKLRAELSEKNQELKRNRELLVASNQAKDMIIARNLHIVDVHDSNGSGERQRPFGRIFYSEGKSLVFYAYDLEGPAIENTRVSFHVWGTKLGDQGRSKNLGILRTEDRSAGRWVLTCDDPKVLSSINTVFVTVESDHKNIDQPSGKRILYAFLNGRPNHP